MEQQIINRNLVWLRQQRGLTQEQLADKLKIPRPSLVKYEQGRSVPVELLQKFSEFFKIPMHDLVEKEMMPEEYKIAYLASRKTKKGKNVAEIKNPFQQDDPLNWERAKIVALERKFAMFLASYEIDVKKAPGTLDDVYERILDELKTDSIKILADLRHGRLTP
ncbi:helix-turn-helix domain-containing protein [Chitinophaga sp. Hz27]|uniref:helix-turn-helix domain-containing protein n=1 Tax=Chitinophaga sp. Hz27 TaxID=3347169 RepID=UPI0035DE5D88